MMALGHLVFFFVGAPFGSNVPLGLKFPYILYALGIIIFAGQGIFYLILLIMMENTIEYNEWKSGERKEAVSFSLRPLTAKLASSLQQGVVYLTLLISGALLVTEKISELEIAKGFDDSLEIIDDANILIQNGNHNMVVLTLIMTVLPFVLYVSAYLILHFKYKIDEEKYAEILRDLEERKKALPSVEPEVEVVES
jgi:melibiose permease/lactose/raffinose/galactose permease